MYIADIPENTLTVDVAEIPTVFIPKVDKIIARHELGKVVLFIMGKRVELNTLTAHKIGYTMAMTKLAPNEMIVMGINGEKIELPGPIALKVSTALLRKADDADDWQLRRKQA